MVANGHSRLPPSSAFRWKPCTASISFVEANDAILPPSGGVEADEGTRAHALLTARLKHTLGQVPDNDEMRVIIDDLVAYIDTLLEGGRLLVDQKVPLFYLPSQTGTLDVAIIRTDRIVILDLKYGKGVGVYAEDNEQLAIYAESQIRVLEVVEEFAPDLPVQMIIYQPRDRNDPRVVREWTLSRIDLNRFCGEIQQAADLILSGGDVKFSPGAPCKFCRATGICEAYKAHAQRGLSEIAETPVDLVTTTPVTMPAPSLLTRDQRQRVLDAKQDMIAWLEAVENQEVAELMTGAAPLSFKLVEGKTNREWVDEKKTATFLAQKGVAIDAIYPPVPPTIVSPAQAETALKASGLKLTKELKAEMAPFVTKPKGKPTLTRVNDPRPALDFNPTQGLEEIPTDASALI